MPPTHPSATVLCEEDVMTASPTYGPATVCHELQAICTERRREDLTPRELQLLSILIDHRDGVVVKTTLLDAIGGTPLVGYRDRRVDVHVAAIRRKFEHIAPEWAFIHTRVGVGYRFQPCRRERDCCTKA